MEPAPLRGMIWASEPRVARRPRGAIKKKIALLSATKGLDPAGGRAAKEGWDSA